MPARKPKFIRMLRDPKATWIAVLTAVIYFVFYLWSIGSIRVLPGAEAWNWMALSNWQELMWKVIAPFLWENVAYLEVAGLTIFLSPLNLVIALILSVLVFLNLHVAIYSLSLSKVCNVKPGFHGALGFLPAFLTGFACCVPTFVIALGALASSVTVFFIEIRPFLIPASVVIMIWGYWWSVRRIKIGQMDQYERRMGWREIKK